MVPNCPHLSNDSFWICLRQFSGSRNTRRECATEILSPTAFGNSFYFVSVFTIFVFVFFFLTCFCLLLLDFRLLDCFWSLSGSRNTRRECAAESLSPHPQTPKLPGALFLGNPSEVTPLARDTLTEYQRSNLEPSTLNPQPSTLNPQP